jgi:hypothetical protein
MPTDSTPAPATSFETTMPAGALSSNVIEALRRGHKIEAIKLVREQTGMGLKEAKDAVDAYERTHPKTPAASPGEVTSSGNGVWWVAALLVAVAAAYYLLR